MLFKKIYNRINPFNPLSPESKQMIQDVGNIELCELLETETQNAVQSVPLKLEYRYDLLQVRAFLAQRNRVTRKFGKIRWTLEYVIKKGRPHGHRYGEKFRRQRLSSG